MAAVRQPSTPRPAFCFMSEAAGGISWDPKPDAPAEYRGEFKPIATRRRHSASANICRMLADRADELAVIRSMTHNDVDHTSATHCMLTGKAPARSAPRVAEDWPNYGAMLSHLGRGKGPLPPYRVDDAGRPNGAPRFVEAVAWAGRRLAGPAVQPDAHRRRRQQARTTASASSTCEPNVPLAAASIASELLRELDWQAHCWTIRPMCRRRRRITSGPSRCCASPARPRRST